MYTLRTVEANQKQTNQLIGDLYSFVERDSNYEEFYDIFKELFGKAHVADGCETADDHTQNVYGFIQHMGNTIPLYKNGSYYIMTEYGKTFSNLSYR